MPFKNKISIRADRSFAIKHWRTAVQTLSLILLNPFVYRQMGVCLPVMNCWACPAAASACPVGVAGGFLAHGLIPFAVIGVFVLTGVIAGRIFCGWVCPFGFLQDLMHKIPAPKYTIPRKVDRKLFILPLLFLVVTVILVPIFFGKESKLFFCAFCPAGALEAALPLHIANNLEAGFVSIAADIAGSWRIWILVVVLVSFVPIKRSFCRFMCPIGLTVGLLNVLSIFKVSHGYAKMSRYFGFGPSSGGLCPTPGCDLCTNDCPVDLNALADVNTKECITCYLCIEACPTQGTLKLLTDNGRVHPFLKRGGEPGRKTKIDLVGKESGTFLKKDLSPPDKSDPDGKPGKEGKKEIIDLDP